MINPQKAVNWYKSRYNTIGESDYDIYEKVKRIYTKDKNGNEYQYPQNPFQMPASQIVPPEEEIEKNNNPGFFEKILTANLSDAFAEDGNWWANAYNNSIAGTIYQIMHGETKYESEAVPQAWYNEAGQFFAGLVSPIDILTFLGSSGIGGAVAKKAASGPLKNLATKGFSQMLQNAGANRATRKAIAGGFHRFLATGAGIESGISLATYGVAGGALQDAAQQSIEIKDGLRTERDYLQTVVNATKHGASSLALGSAAGFVTKGLMAPKFAKAKMASDATFANKITRLTMNPAGQVVAEGALFGTGQLAERALMGEQVNLDDWLSSIFMNTAVVGGLRASLKPLRLGQNDVTRYKEAKRQFYGDIYEKAGFKVKKGPDSKQFDLLKVGEKGELSTRYEKLENIERQLANSGIAAPEALIKEKAKIEAEARGVFTSIPEFEKNLSTYEKKLKNIDNIPKLNSRKERVKARAELLKDFGYINNTLYAIYKEMRASVDKFFKPEELSTKEKRAGIEKELDRKIKSLEDVNEMVNLGALNDPKIGKKMRQKFAASFDVSVKEVKNKEGEIVYEPVLTTPKGNTIETGIRTEGRNEAYNLGDKLRQDYQQELLKERVPAKQKDKKVTEETKELKLEEEAIPGIPEFESPGIEFVVSSKDKPVGAKDAPVKTVNEGIDFLIASEKERQKKEFELQSISEKIPMSKSVLNTKIAEKDSISQLKKKKNESFEKFKERIKKENKDLTKEEIVLAEIKESDKPTGKLIRKILNRDTDYEASALVGYAKDRLSGDIGRAKADITSGVIKNPKNALIEIARFLDKFSNKDLTDIKMSDLNKYFNELIPGKKDGNTTSNKAPNELSLFFNWAATNKFLDVTLADTLKRFSRGVVTEYNDWVASGAGKNPAKKGVRKFVIEEASKSNDKGLEIAAKLGAKYFIRNQEINKLAEIIKEKGPKVLEKYLKLEESTGEYYLAMDSNFVKYGTFNRFVFIDKPLAIDMMNYINGGGSLINKATLVGKLIQKGKMTDNPSSAFYDLRRRGKSIGAKLNPEEQATENYLFGHDRTRISRTYDIKNVDSLIRLQKEYHKKINTPIENVKFKEGASRGPFKQGFDPKREEFLNNMRILDNLSDKQLQQVKLGKGVLGMFIDAAESAILLSKDLFQPTDFFHEKFHKIKAYARDVNDTKLLKSLNSLERLAKNTPEYKQWKSKKQNKNRDMEEFTADVTGDKAQAIAFAPNVFAKIKQAIQQVVSRIKTIVGVGNFNDYANVMARRLTQKLDTTGVQFTGGKAKFKITEQSFKNSGSMIKSINRNIRVLAKEYGVNANDLINYTIETANISTPKYKLPKSKINEANMQARNDLIAFAQRFDEIADGRLTQFLNQKEGFKKLTLISQIEKRRLPKDITEKELKSLVKTGFKSKDGNLFDLSVSELKTLKEYITNQANVKNDGLSWVTQTEINNLISSAFRTGQKGKEELAMGLGTTHKAVGTVGYKTIQEKLLTHESIQESNQAGLLNFNDKGLKVVGGNFLTREINFSKLKDNLVVALDNNGEVLFAYQKAKAEIGNKLSKKQIKMIDDAQSFLDKAVLPEWKKTIKEKGGKKFGDGLAKMNKDGTYKYLNPNTKEGQIAILYVDNIVKNFGKNKFMEALRQNTNDAQFESLMKNSDLKWVEDGIYITRSLKNEARDILFNGSTQREAVVNKLASQIAVRRAKKKYGKNYTDEQLSKELETAHFVAETRLNDSLFFNPSKISIKYLKERYDLQPVFVQNEKGQYIRSYHNTFDRTVTPYVSGMAKFYATVEMFPEVIQGLKPGNGINKVFDKIKESMPGATREKEINWVKEVVEKQLGVDKSSSPFDLTYRGLESYARIAAKLGLSFPTAGLKNVLTGTTQTVFAHQLRDIAKGFALVFSRDAEVYRRALNSNAFSIGNILYEGRNTVDKILDATAFKAGFMRPTEKFNRLLAIAASIAEQNRLLNNIKLHPKGSKIYKKSVDRLKSFYFLNDGEIALRRKYATRGEVKADNTLSQSDKLRTIRNVENINNKMNLYAHVNTQGSSADIFMPKFAGYEGIRPFTLFKRMAFAATDNTQNNVREAIRNGNLMKPVMGLTATYISGQAMMGVYKALLNTDMPKENSDWWTRFKTTMYKGEIFGILSELFSPFDTGFQQTLEPAIYNNAATIYTELGQLVEGKSNYSQFGKNVLKGTFSGYSNVAKVYHRKLNKLNSDRIRISKLYKDFMEEKGKPMPQDMQKNKLSPYYSEFKNSFYQNRPFGKEKDAFAEQFFSTFFAIAHDRVRYGRPMDVAFKEAASMMRSKLRQLNPNKGSLFKSSKTGKRNSLEFIKWLQQSKDAKELTMTLFEAEAQYKKRLVEFMKHLPVYAKTHNIKNFYDDHNWEVAQGF